MNRKWIAIVTLLVLMLSVCVLAAAEEPTDPVYPVPGPLEKHEHTVSIKIVDRGYTAHRLNEWCPDCGRLLKERIEKHNFVDGVCTVCDWECPHPPEAAEKHYERDGVKPQWDGNYIIGPGWEITECGVCRTVLSRVETTVREFHNVHTHFTPVLECLPHDADTHALIRYCDECGTEVPEYVPHNCPPSDRPYTDEGDPDTHSRLVRCADCGFWVPQQQAHTWVHDSYRKDETDGGEEGHIEVMKCSVCGAKKEVRQPHGAGTHVAYRQDGNADTHIEVLQCPLCNETFEKEQPHELVLDSYKHDGDSTGHLDVYKCTVCGQTVETRVPHSPKHVIWKSVSDTQDQEVVYCAICGATYALAPVAHQFDSFAYESDMLDNHTVYRACVKCGACEKGGKTYTEAHVFNGSMCCVKCGQSSGHWGYHIAETGYTLGWVAVDDERHAPINKCKDYSCRAEFVNYSWPKPHTFDPVTMKCTGCGFLKEGCEHHYTQAVYYAKDGHYIAGKCVKCGKPLEKPYFVQHTMQTIREIYFQSSDNFHTRAEIKRCSACGYECIVYNGKAAHEFISLGDYQSCVKCGYVTGTSCEHEFERTKLESQDAYVHTVQLKCKKCGVLASKLEEHDLKVISDSGWQKVNENLHTHTVHYQCSVCGYETTVAENEAHELSTMPERYENIWDRKVHNKITGDECKKCGFTTNENVEKLNHHFGADIHGDVCTDCGYRRRY